MPSSLQQRAEAFAIFGEIDRIRRRADDRHAGFVQTHREIQRRLAAKLDDHTVRLFDIDDVHHVFERERLEVETIRSVVISRNSFRIAVDHDRFETRFVQRERRVAAAVIKLDSLPDAVRSGAENHDLAFDRSAALRLPLRKSSKDKACTIQTQRRRCPRVCKPESVPSCFAIGAHLVFGAFRSGKRAGDRKAQLL